MTDHEPPAVAANPAPDERLRELAPKPGEIYAHLSEESFQGRVNLRHMNSGPLMWAVGHCLAPWFAERVNALLAECAALRASLESTRTRRIATDTDVGEIEQACGLDWPDPTDGIEGPEDSRRFVQAAFDRARGSSEKREP